MVHVMEPNKINLQSSSRRTSNASKYFIKYDSASQKGYLSRGLHLSTESRPGTSPGIDPYAWTVEVQQANS